MEGVETYGPVVSFCRDLNFYYSDLRTDCRASRFDTFLRNPLDVALPRQLSSLRRHKGLACERKAWRPPYK